MRVRALAIARIVEQRRCVRRLGDDRRVRDPVAGAIDHAPGDDRRARELDVKHLRIAAGKPSADGAACRRPA